jgi:hypothetical protein
MANRGELQYGRNCLAVRDDTYVARSLDLEPADLDRASFGVPQGACSRLLILCLAGYSELECLIASESLVMMQATSAQWSRVIR